MEIVGNSEKDREKDAVQKNAESDQTPGGGGFSYNSSKSEGRYSKEITTPNVLHLASETLATLHSYNSSDWQRAYCSSFRSYQSQLQPVFSWVALATGFSSTGSSLPLSLSNLLNSPSPPPLCSVCHLKTTTRRRLYQPRLLHFSGSYVIPYLRDRGFKRLLTATLHQSKHSNRR